MLQGRTAQQESELKVLQSQSNKVRYCAPSGLLSYYFLFFFAAVKECNSNQKVHTYSAPCFVVQQSQTHTDSQHQMLAS